MKHVENKNKNKTQQRSKRRFIITRERIPQLYKWESFFLPPSLIPKNSLNWNAEWNIHRNFH